MKMRTSILLMLFCFGLLNSYGQKPTYDFGIKGGINASVFEIQSDNLSIQPLIGFSTSVMSYL